jgi:hypothetical protein
MPEEAAAAVAESQSTGPTQEPSTSGGSDIYHHKLGESGGSDGQTREAAEPKDGGDQDRKPAAQKPLSRYERTKRERAAFRAEREAFQRERAAFMQEKAAAAKPKRDYTLADLQKYRGQWEREGQFDLVEAADKEIAIMQQEAEAERAARTVEMPPAGSPEHRAQWEAAERELYQADPEFMRSGTRLDKLLRSIMSGPDGNIYRQHPRGIVAAYHQARMLLLEADLNGLRTTNSKLETELKRYQGLTGVGSGAPSRMGYGARVENLSDFERLSTKDMRKHLMSNADKNGVPWF